MLVELAFCCIAATSVGDESPSQEVKGLVVPILNAACEQHTQALQPAPGADTPWVSTQQQRLDALLAHLFRQETADADEALVILLRYYLGEAEGEDVGESVISRGIRMLPLLEKWRLRSPKGLDLSGKCQEALRLDEHTVEMHFKELDRLIRTERSPLIHSESPP